MQAPRSESYSKPIDIIAVAFCGADRDILTNVHVLAVKAGIESVSSGLAHAAESSSNSFRLPALVATVLFIHISMVS